MHGLNAAVYCRKEFSLLYFPPITNFAKHFVKPKWASHVITEHFTVIGLVASWDITAGAERCKYIYIFSPKCYCIQSSI